MFASRCIKRPCHRDIRQQSIISKQKHTYLSYIDDEGASASGDHGELSAERRVLRADAHDEVEGGVCQGVARVEGKDREGAGAGTAD